MIEVEKKAYLKNPDTLEKIKQLAFYKGEKHKEDIYFAPILQKERIDVYKDPIFRIRVEEGKKILSFKKKKIIEKTEINEEQEIDISSLDIQKLRTFFQYIGFYPFIEKKKKTHLYLIKNREGLDINIEHNFIEKLGEFIEVEILVSQEEEIKKANQIIDQFYKEIGIEEKDIEPRYYIDLLMEQSV